MEHIGAGLAALGVIGPGIGIGILAGMAAAAIGRNPDAAGQIRGLAIILAAFAEGLGVLAIVVGLLAIFIKPSGPGSVQRGPARRRRRRRAVRRRALAAGERRSALSRSTSSGSSSAALNFLAVLRHHLDLRASSRSRAMLADRQERIEQGLKDAEQARKRPRSRRAGAAPRPWPRRAARRTTSWPAPSRSPRRRATRTSPRPARRSSGCATQAAAEIEAEKQRALADVRAQVADLALAGRRQGRRRDHDRRAPASSRGGVPGRGTARGQRRLAGTG